MLEFKRLCEKLIIIVDNLATLEAVSEFIFLRLKTTYLIQIEKFPNLTIYQIAIPCQGDFDTKIKRDITNFLKARPYIHLQLEEESE